MKRLSSQFHNLAGVIVFSNLADGFLSISISLLAIRATSDPLLISLATTAGTLPVLVAAIPTGVLADRFNRATLMTVSNSVRAIVAGGLSVMVASGNLSIAAIYVAVFVVGMFEPLYDNSADALVPATAGRDNLGRANAIVQGWQYVSQTLIAVPLAAALFVSSAIGPILVSAITFAATALWSMRLKTSATGILERNEAASAQTPGRRNLGARDGIAFVWHNPVLRLLTLSLVVIAFALAVAQSTLTLYIIEVLGVPERFVGAFAVTLAAGGLLAMRVAPVAIRRLGITRTLPVAVVSLAVGLLVMGLAGNPWWGAGAAVLMSGGVTLWNVAAVTARQTLTPDRLLGRVQGVGATLGSAAALLGTPIGGLIGRSALRLPFLVGAAIVLAATLLVLRIPRFSLSSPDPGQNDSDHPADKIPAAQSTGQAQSD